MRHERRMLPRLREGGPAWQGAIGAAVLVLVLATAVVVPRLTFQAATNTYTAEFTNAAGLTSGDQVYVAGVPAGRVTSVELAGDRVRVGFRLDRDQPLGDATTASVKLATVLGTRYLGVRPAGPGRLEGGEVIPRGRTSVPYGLGQLGKDAANTASGLDLPALRSMMDTLRGVTQDPRRLGDALTGITGAARLLSSRDTEIRKLLEGSKAVTTSLLEQRDTLTSLLGDAELVATTLHQRRDTIRRLIDDVHRIAVLLERVLAETGGTLGPLLADLHGLTDSLAARDAEIGATLERLGPASRYLANATGNGPWGDVSGPAGPIPDNLLCIAGLLEGCR